MGLLVIAHMDIPFVCFNRKCLETILTYRGAALSKIDGVFIVIVLTT